MKFIALLSLFVLVACSSGENEDVISATEIEGAKDFTKNIVELENLFTEANGIEVDWSAEMTYEEQIEVIKAKGLGEGNITHKDGNTYLESGKYVVGEDLEPGRYGVAGEGHFLLLYVPEHGLMDVTLADTFFYMEFIEGTIIEVYTEAIFKKDSVNHENHVGSNEESAEEVPTLALGETFSNDDIEVTIKSIEYLEDRIQVYFEVLNKSEEPLERPGSLKFSLKEGQFEEEFNNLGYGHHFNETDFYVYQDERRDGYYQYLYDRNVTITEIRYHYSVSGLI